MRYVCARFHFAVCLILVSRVTSRSIKALSLRIVLTWFGLEAAGALYIVCQRDCEFRLSQ